MTVVSKSGETLPSIGYYYVSHTKETARYSKEKDYYYEYDNDYIYYHDGYEFQNALKSLYDASYWNVCDLDDIISPPAQSDNSGDPSDDSGSNDNESVEYSGDSSGSAAESGS